MEAGVAVGSFCAFARGRAEPGISGHCRAKPGEIGRVAVGSVRAKPGISGRGGGFDWDAAAAGVGAAEAVSETWADVVDMKSPLSAWCVGRARIVRADSRCTLEHHIPYLMRICK